MSDQRSAGCSGDAAALPPVRVRAGGPGAAAGSPCINICLMHAATGWCAGCLRTLDEITAWSRMDEAQRKAVHGQLDGRRATWGRLQAAGLAPTVLVPHSSLPAVP